MAGSTEVSRRRGSACHRPRGSRTAPPRASGSATAPTACRVRPRHVEAGRSADCGTEITPSAGDSRPLDGPGLDVGEVDQMSGRGPGSAASIGGPSADSRTNWRRHAIGRPGTDSTAGFPRTRCRAGERGLTHRLSLAEREQVKPGTACSEWPPRRGWKTMQSPGPIRRRRAPMPGDATPGEHVEDLLLASVIVDGRRPAAGRDLDPRTPTPIDPAASPRAVQRPRM